MNTNQLKGKLCFVINKLFNFDEAGDCETFSKCFGVRQYSHYQFDWSKKLNQVNLLLNQNKNLRHQLFSYSLAKFHLFQFT